MAQTGTGKRTYTYDELDHLVRVNYEDGREAIYSYDETGNIIATMVGPADELIEPAKMEERVAIEERTEAAPPPSETVLRCASCGAELRPDAKFCKSCGAPVVQQAQVPQVKYCRNCGQPLPPDAAFCGKCGTPVRQ